MLFQHFPYLLGVILAFYSSQYIWFYSVLTALVFFTFKKICSMNSQIQEQRKTPIHRVSMNTLQMLRRLLVTMAGPISRPPVTYSKTTQRTGLPQRSVLLIEISGTMYMYVIIIIYIYMYSVKIPASITNKNLGSGLQARKQLHKMWIQLKLFTAGLARFDVFTFWFLLCCDFCIITQ